MAAEPVEDERMDVRVEPGPVTEALALTAPDSNRGSSRGHGGRGPGKPHARLGPLAWRLDHYVLVHNSLWNRTLGADAGGAEAPRSGPGRREEPAAALLEPPGPPVAMAPRASRMWGLVPRGASRPSRAWAEQARRGAGRRQGA